jgi:hypothetical protein
VRPGETTLDANQIRFFYMKNTIIISTKWSGKRDSPGGPQVIEIISFKFPTKAKKCGNSNPLCNLYATIFHVLQRGR